MRPPLFFIGFLILVVLQQRYAYADASKSKTFEMEIEKWSSINFKTTGVIEGKTIEEIPSQKKLRDVMMNHNLQKIR